MRTFHSKVGWWYWAVLLLCSCFLFWGFWVHETLLTLVFAFLVIFEIEMLIHTEYILIGKETFAVRTGRFLKSVSIPLEQIVSIEKSHSFESAPALSLSRLKITYKTETSKTYILISPKNPDDFVKVLLKANPLIILNM